MTRWMGAAAATAAACLCLLAAPVAADESARDPADEVALLERLAVAPGDAEARFALGRLYFERRLDRAAEFHLRQALADSLAPASAQEARSLLAALERRRRWIVSFDSALLPDRDASELNAAATESTGFGVIVSASAEHRAPIGESTRISLQLTGFGDLFENDDFNNGIVTALAGPLWLLEGDDLWSLRAFAQRRWYAGAREYDAVGVELATLRSLTDRLRVSAHATARDVDYVFDARDGAHLSADVDLTRYGPEGRFERLFADIFHADAAIDYQRFWRARIGVGGYRETHFGLGLYVEPFVARAEFDGLDPIGGEPRVDTEYGGRLRIVKRDWRLYSAAPYVELEARRLESNISLYDDSAEGLEFGLTRSF